MTCSPRISNRISIHALRGEGDHNFSSVIYCYRKFQSTPSVGRATFLYFLNRSQIVISIHALRGEGDLKCDVDMSASYTISIHALRGEGDM